MADETNAKVKTKEAVVAVLKRADGTKQVYAPRPAFHRWLMAAVRSAVRGGTE